MRANTLAVTLLRRRKIHEKKTKKRNVYTYIYIPVSIENRYRYVISRSARDSLSQKPETPRGSPVIQRRNFGKCRFREKKFAAMQNRDSPSQNRANGGVSRRVPDVQKLADCALHLPRSIPLSREREREKERGMAIEFARVNSAQKRKPGTLATPFAEHWLGLLMQFFYRAIPRIFFPSRDLRRGKKRGTSDNYLQK